MFIAKKLVSLSFVEALFFKKLILNQNPCFNFSSKQVLMNDILPRMAEFTKDKYVFSSFESCHSYIVFLNLWMFKARMDTFVMIVHFLNAQWEPCHIIVGLFEIVDTTRSAMDLQVIDVLAKHGLITR